MDRGSYIEKTLLILGLILIFSSMPADHIEDYKYLSSYLFRFGGMFIIIATFSSIMRREVIFSNTLKLFTYLYGGFISLIILSVIVNRSLEVEVYSLEKFIFVFLFLGVSLTLVDGISEKLIVNSLIISLGVIFIYYLIEFPISESDGAYSASFSNPNRFGMVAVTFAIICLVAGTSLLKARRNYFLATLYLLITIGVSYLVMLSSSRTSFIALVIILGIVSTTFTYELLKSRNLLTWKSIFIVFLLALGGTSLFILIDNPIYAALESNIIDKFKRKIEGNRITAGRTELWVATIKDANLFGKVGYFDDNFYVHAHNSFLQIIIIHGWFAGLAYIVFWITMFIKSTQHYLTEKLTNAYAILPLVVITNFILLSMTELVEFHVSTYLATSMVAILSKPKEKTLAI